MVYPPLRDAPVARPVVFVPGIIGSKLRDRHTGKATWGTGINTILPHDGGDRAVLPLALADDAEARLEAYEVVDVVKLLWIKREVFGSLADLLTNHGYQMGDLAAPKPEDNLFFFAYDWRWPNARGARLLYEQLEALRKARGEERLEIDLICQSNGAHLCRYLLKYSGASLDDAEAGRASPPAHIEAVRLILVGTANGGAMRTLREINRGRRYVPVIGRAWGADTLFSFRALFEDLPAYRQNLFIDEKGEPLDVDLYDPESWRRYGWGIYTPAARKRLERNPRTPLFGDETTKLDYLTRRLEEAKRFQALLHRDVPGFGASRYYLVQAIYTPTPDRAVLVQENGTWHTYFAGDPELLARFPYANALSAAPGDGHATLASQYWLSPQERAALSGPSYTLDGGHFALILDRGTQRHILKVLSSDPD